MFARAQKVTSNVLTQIPQQGGEEILTQMPQDSFVTDRITVGFKDCIQAGGATSLGCAALIGGSVVSVWWNKGRAERLANEKKLVEAGDLLFKKGEEAKSAGRYTDAVELFRGARKYYNETDKAVEAELQFATANYMQGGELRSKGDDAKAVKYLQEAAWAYSRIGRHEFAANTYDALLAPAFLRLDKPGEATGAFENAGRGYAEAGNFSRAAGMFITAAGLKEKAVPDAPDAMRFVPKHRGLNLFLWLAERMGDVKQEADLRFVLARKIGRDYMNRFPLPYGCGGCGGFLEHIVYQYRRSAEAYFKAKQYVDAVVTLHELVEVLERRGYGASFEEMERLNAIRRAREMIDAGVGEIGGLIEPYNALFNDLYEKTPYKVKKEAADRIARDIVSSAEMLVLSGSADAAEGVFTRAEKVYSDMGLEDAAKEVRQNADVALGFFGYEHVREKWKDRLPSMTLAERRNRIVQLQGLGVQVVRENGLDGLKEQSNHMIRYAEGAIKEMEAERLYAKDGMTRGWFEVQLYYAKGQIYSILAGGGIGDEVREAEKAVLWQELEAMRMRIEEMPEYRRDAADFRKMVEGMAAEGHEFAKDALRGMDASGQRDIGSKVLAIRMRLETAYRQFERAAMTEASDSLNLIAVIAKREGFKVLEAIARVANGDIHIMDGSRPFATMAYDAALSVLEGGEYQETARIVAALKAEALGEGGNDIVTKIWAKVPPQAWLFRNALAELDGGVADQSLKDAVPPPEVAMAEGVTGRARMLSTRREFLKMQDALKEPGKALETAKKK